MAANMKMIVFWDTSPCRLPVDRRFRGVYCFHYQGDRPDEGDSTQL